MVASKAVLGGGVRKPRSAAALRKQSEDCNARHAVPVRLDSCEGGSTTIRSPAEILSRRSAVIWPGRIRGGCPLDPVMPIFGRCH